MSAKRTEFRWPLMRIGDTIFAWSRRTYIMGIINMTPDSFSGDGFDRNVGAAAIRATILERHGADLIDVGGASSRPGAAEVSPQLEADRALPAVRAICARVSLPVSIDTTRAAVAERALTAGAAVINDVSGLTADRGMARLARERDAPVIVVAGRRSTAADVVERVHEDLRESLTIAGNAGLSEERLIIDPGFGFGKRWFENLELLRRLPELLVYGLPLMVGLSRKETIERVLGSEREQHLPANAALSALAIAGGADILRVHDVPEMCAAAKIADAAMRPETLQNL